MVTASRPPAPAFGRAVLTVFDLSVGQMLWSRRSFFLAIALGVPVLLAIGVRAAAGWVEEGLPALQTAGSGHVIFLLMHGLLFVQFLVPALGVFYGTSLIADEVEDRTLTYLFVRPVPRAAVLLGKYAAYLACTVLLAGPALLLMFFVVVPIGGGGTGRAWPVLLAALGQLAAGLAAYGAVFALLGVSLTRSLIAGLLFAFGWEPVARFLPGYLGRLTLGHYLGGLGPPLPEGWQAASLLSRLSGDNASLEVGLAVLLAATGGSLLFASAVVQRREYVLDQ